MTELAHEGDLSCGAVCLVIIAMHDARENKYIRFDSRYERKREREREHDWRAYLAEIALLRWVYPHRAHERPPPDILHRKFLSQVDRLTEQKAMRKIN